MKTLDYETLADLVDFMLEQRKFCFGLYNTISWLSDYGLTREQIISLGYDEETVDIAMSMDEEDGIDNED